MQHFTPLSLRVKRGNLNACYLSEIALTLYDWHNLIEMEYYVLTNLGKQMLPKLIKEKRDDEANILAFLLRAEAATVEQIAQATRQGEAMLYYKLRSFSENRWVRRQSKAAKQF